MSITLGENSIYLIAILVLMAVQAFQFHLIKKIKSEIDQVWSQMGTIVLSISSKMMEMQKDIGSKKDKNEDVDNSKTTD
jgi:steroid 5-alpha reductase family enzyme